MKVRNEQTNCSRDYFERRVELVCHCQRLSGKKSNPSSQSTVQNESLNMPGTKSRWDSTFVAMRLPFLRNDHTGRIPIIGSSLRLQNSDTIRRLENGRCSVQIEILAGTITRQSQRQTFRSSSEKSIPIRQVFSGADVKDSHRQRLGQGTNA